MKKVSVLLLLVFFGISAFTQVAINTDESSADNSAMLGEKYRQRFPGSTNDHDAAQWYQQPGGGINDL